MIFPRACDPTLCTGDGGRYSIAGVALLRWRNGHALAATNGRALVLIPVQLSEDGEALGNATKVLPADAIAQARKVAKSLRKADARLELNGSIEVPGKDGQLARFPYMEDRFPELTEGPCGVVPTEPVRASVTINAEYLVALQRAMGAEAVQLCVHHLTENGQVDDSMPLTVKPVAIAPLPAPDAFGVLMPIKDGAP